MDYQFKRDGLPRGFNELDLSEEQKSKIRAIMAQYRPMKNLRIGLHANNLFNQEYRTVPNMLSYGAPRSIMATFRYEF